MKRVKKTICKRGHPLEGDNVFGRNQCKTCHTVAVNAYEQKPKCKKYRRAYHKATYNTPRAAGYRKSYYLAHKEEFRKWHFFRKYGISIEQLEALKIQQGYKCLICGIHEKDTVKGLVVDHNHTTGKVRGLLCNICNSHVVHTVETYPHLLEKAAKYLEDF